MGIVDLVWLNDEHFLTASSDNSVKKWNVNEDTAVKVFTQGDQKRDASR